MCIYLHYFGSRTKSQNQKKAIQKEKNIYQNAKKVLQDQKKKTVTSVHNNFSQSWLHVQKIHTCRLFKA